MSEGTPVERQWVMVLKNGTVIIDWGDGFFQDVHTGDFIEVLEQDISHHVTNEDLEILVKAGRVGSFTNLKVCFHSLPERPHKTLE